MAGVVLAAGEGRRFGGPKALARIDGICFVERVAAMLTSGGCDRVVVVLGAAADEVIATADLRTVEVVVAPDWRDGMAASLRAGIGAADAVQAAAAVIALVDQPWVGPESVARLRQAWRNGATAAVATYGGDPRHPVLFGDRRHRCANLAARQPGTGDRRRLRRHRRSSGRRHPRGPPTQAGGSAPRWC
jgi:nicotine blue oxidoreductase